jgi:hypothetical protein
LGTLSIGASGGVRLGLNAEPTVPLRLSFPLPGGDGAVSAVHVSDDGTMTALPSTVQDGKLIVTTNQFSTVGWISGVWNFFSGETTPNSCNGAPAWASVLGYPPSVHACISSNPASDGHIRAEVDIKSNRGTWQNLTIEGAPRPEYVWAEDQPDWLVSVYRSLLGQGDGFLLLPPGKRVTAGYAQPSSYQDVRIDDLPPTGMLWAVSLGSAVLSAAGWTTPGNAYLAAFAAAFKCLGGTYIPFTPPSLSTIDKIGVARCVTGQLRDLASDPEKIFSVLPSALRLKIPQDAYLSIAHGARAVGKVALALELISASSVVWTQLVDQLNAAMGSVIANQIVLGLDAPAPQRTTTSVPTIATPTQPTFNVMNTSEQPPDGVWFRNSPHQADTSRVTGLGVYQGESIMAICYATGDAVGPYANTIWYYAQNMTRPTNNGQPNRGYLNAHYVNDGMTTNVPYASVPTC